MTLDLHCHSNASDGAFDPADVVARAAAAGVTTLALTDHDTLGGLAEASEAARVAGIELAPGTELSVRRPTGSMHLLAYLPSLAPEPLASRMQQIGEYRSTRNRRIVARLAELGFPVRWEAVAAKARGKVGRPHIAAALVDAGYVDSVQQAFDELLSDDGPAYLEAGSFGPAEAIGLVRSSGAAPVLAHPYTLRLAGAGLDAFVAELAQAGLIGLECFRADHDHVMREANLALCQRHGLVPTGGSDFHGTRDDRIGDVGAVPVPAGTYAELMRRATS